MKRRDFFKFLGSAPFGLKIALQDIEGDEAHMPTTSIEEKTDINLGSYDSDMFSSASRVIVVTSASTVWSYPAERGWRL